MACSLWALFTLVDDIAVKLLNLRMDVPEIHAILRRIRELKSQDPDEAQSTEENLYRRVLRAIADGARHPHKLAKEAMKAEEISFQRF